MDTINQNKTEEQSLQSSKKNSSNIELSVVIPCLNEADTLRTCIKKVQHALIENNISGEIIIADNGSTDGSQDIAYSLGTKIINVEAKGYGNALMEGIEAAQGKFIVMGDADDSYDFNEIPKFLKNLQKGFDLVMGCRLPAGGGHVFPRAMPFLHRWLGNPFFSLLIKWWFKGPINDVYCGMRGFTKNLYNNLNMQCTGMEFAVEMVIKSCIFNAKIAEIPITLHLDGRKSHKPHLKTFQDGWRTLRFFLLYSPQWLFLVPGGVLVLLGLTGYILAMPQIKIMFVTFDLHTLLFASLSILCGYQSILFAFLAKTYAINEGLYPEDPFMTLFWKTVNLEKGLLLGLISMLIGTILLLGAVYQWKVVNFGSLDYVYTMRWVIPGVTLTMLGFQTILFGFFGSILGLRKRKSK